MMTLHTPRRRHKLSFAFFCYQEKKHMADNGFATSSKRKNEEENNYYK